MSSRVCGSLPFPAAPRSLTSLPGLPSVCTGHAAKALSSGGFQQISVHSWTHGPTVVGGRGAGPFTSHDPIR